jgi:hypothetical protein
VIYNLYVVITYISSTGHIPLSMNIASFLYPPTPSLLVVLFGLLYFFMTIRKITLPIVAKIATYVLVNLATLAFIVALVLTSQSSSSDAFHFAFTLLYHYLFPSLLTSAAALIGCLTLIVKLILHKTRKLK